MDAKKRAALVRLRTNPKSKLTRIDLVRMLSDPEAWVLLPPETQRRLYAMLPKLDDDEKPYDTDVNPLRSHKRRHFEIALLRWQRELSNGYHTKTHRSHEVDDMSGNATNLEKGSSEKTVGWQGSEPNRAIKSESSNDHDMNGVPSEGLDNAVNEPDD